MSFIPTTDTVIINKLFSMVESFTYEHSLRVNLQKLFGGSIKLILVYGLYFIYKYGIESITSSWKGLLWRLIYKRLIIDKSKQSIFKADSQVVYENVFPLYFEKEDSNHVVYHLPYIHDSTINKLKTELMGPLDHKTLFIENDKKINLPLNLFPSNNCLALEELLDGYFEVFHHSRMVSSPLILINGKPGLGKSDSRYYLASLNKYDEIIYYNLLDLTNKSFSSIITALLNKESTKTTVVFFDELDKYIELYVRYMFKLEKRGKNSNGGSNMDEIVDTDIQHFRVDVKENIIQTISNLNAGIHNYQNGIAFVFCANNFETVFDGLRQKHITSVKTRFTFVEFKECERSELIRYIRTFNDRLKGTKYWYDDNRLGQMLRRLKDDVRITYRDISICHNKARYDIEKLVQCINDGVYNPLLEYTCVEEENSRVKVCDEMKEAEPLMVVDRRMGEIEKIREEQKSKDQLAKEIYWMIEGREDATEEDLPDDEEALTKMIEMSKGYNLMEIVEHRIKMYGDELYIITSLVWRKLVKCLEYVIDYCGANVDFDFMIKSALLMGSLDVIMCLLKRGAKLGEEYPYEFLSQVRYPNVLKEVVTFLIHDRCFDINQNIKGSRRLLTSFLTTVAFRVNGDIVRFLFDNGYKLTEPENNEICLGLCGVETLNYDLLGSLIDNGLKVNIYPNNGMSFFCMFVYRHYKRYNQHLDVFNLLVKAEAHLIPFHNDKPFDINSINDSSLREVLSQFL